MGEIIDIVLYSIKDRGMVRRAHHKESGEKVEYEMRSHARARRIKITVHADGRVVVIKPTYLPDFIADLYVQSESKWIQESLGSGI